MVTPKLTFYILHIWLMGWNNQTFWNEMTEHSPTSCVCPYFTQPWVETTPYFLFRVYRYFPALKSCLEFLLYHLTAEYTKKKWIRIENQRATQPQYSNQYGLCWKYTTSGQTVNFLESTGKIQVRSTRGRLLEVAALSSSWRKRNPKAEPSLSCLLIP